jgi:hypothetical protein
LMEQQGAIAESGIDVTQSESANMGGKGQSTEVDFLP